MTDPSVDDTNKLKFGGRSFQNAAPMLWNPLPDPLKKSTRGQRPNESQKAVIIDMMKSVGEIASKMWPIV